MGLLYILFIDGSFDFFTELIENENYKSRELKREIIVIVKSNYYQSHCKTIDEQKNLKIEIKNKPLLDNKRASFILTLFTASSKAKLSLNNSLKTFSISC